jgi:hypothetical protein
MESLTRTAVKVPGRNTIVTTVIVCIDELSCAILFEVSRFVELSSCVTILNT